MRQHALIWFIIILLSAMVLPVLTSTVTYSTTLKREIAASVYYYGKDDAKLIARNANKTYLAIIEAIYIEQGKDLIAKAVDALPKRRDGRILGLFDAPPGGTRKALDRPIFSIYLLCWRLEHYLTWLFYVFPVIAALLFDGFMTRKARAAALFYSSPSRYNFIWHSFIALASINVILMFSALPLPVFTFPIVLIGFGLLVRGIAASLQSSA